MCPRDMVHVGVSCRPSIHVSIRLIRSLSMGLVLTVFEML
jgi:hypothetical protein